MSDINHPVYAGVPVGEILDSLQTAETFLRSEAKTPQLQTVLDTWKDAEPFRHIAEAKTPQTVDAILRETGTAELLHAFHSVFALKALGERGKVLFESDISAFNLYKDLARWGAFDFYAADHEATFNSDIDSYLAAVYAKEMREECFVDKTQSDNAFDYPPERQRFMHYMKFSLSQPGQQDLTQADLLDGMKSWKNFILYARQNDMTSVINKYQDYSDTKKTMVREFSAAVIGFDMRKAMMRDLSPFKTYGMSLDKKPLDSQAVSTLKSFLKEDRNTGCVRDISTGALPGGGYGFLIRTTENTAKKLAEHFPENKVLDPLGQKVSAGNGGRGPHDAPGTSGPDAPSGP